MAGGSNYSIITDVELDLSSIKSQLKGIDPKIKISADSSGLDKATNSAKNLNDIAKDIGLTFQEANMIMDASASAIRSMVDQVFELDSALTEFKKVSDLSEEGLQSYTSQLSQAGKQFGRTG